jgi:hypothetical protein
MLCYIFDKVINLTATLQQYNRLFKKNLTSRRDCDYTFAVTTLLRILILSNVETTNEAMQEIL